MHPDAEQARQQFRLAENALLQGLNGIGRPVADDGEIVVLRRAVLQARHACDQAGVQVETLWEFAEKRRRKQEAAVRVYAAEQAAIATRVPFALRRRIAFVFGCVAALVTLLASQTPLGVLGSLLAGITMAAIIEAFLVSVFPTPAARVARMACSLEVDVADLWPEGSAERQDYRYAYRLHHIRRRRRGEGGVWIRAR